MFYCNKRSSLWRIQKRFPNLIADDRENCRQLQKSGGSDVIKLFFSSSLELFCGATILRITTLSIMTSSIIINKTLRSA